MKEDDLTKDSVIIKEFMSESKPVERIKVLDYICALQNENNDLKMKLRDLMEENHSLRAEYGVYY